jgi:hypoxanthine phosphoribosyltransferase
MEFIKISWEKLYKDCVTLAKYAANSHADEIVAISRGGVVMGRLLSDFLDLPMSNISMHSYIGTLQTKEPEIVAKLTKNIAGKTILVVDDVSDTGITFQKAIPYLERLGASKIYSVAPYAKLQTKYIPDFCVEKTDKWIIFPYEIWESQKELERQLGSKEEAKKKLQELGVADWEMYE